MVVKLAPSIPFQPEELLRGGERMGVRTRCVGNIGEGAGDGGRGLQIETGVCPAQHQFIVQQLKTQMNGGRNARRVFDGHVAEWKSAKASRNASFGEH